ncbi:MAG: stage II sporulation protein D [Clostridiales bacterium]|nr:stage II sporulation protein D [Clostridiales bacterium]
MRVFIFLLIIALVFVYGCGSREAEKIVEEPKLHPIDPESVDEENNEAQDDRILMINVYMTKNNKIVSMPFEEYVKGVVAAEMPAAFEMEALKAQAVAARTYALSRLKEFGGSGCELHKGADICTDFTHCQAYAEKGDMVPAWGKDTDYYWDKISRAVEDTKGEVAMYEDLLIDPVFHAISGGKTENSEDVWRNSIPYLRSVDSPYEEEASKFKTTVEYSRRDFVNILKRNVQGLKINENKLSSEVKIIDYTVGGRVRNIKVGNKVISGRDFQTYMGLNSNNFVFEFNGDTIKIIVTGYGHGVGMSQYGANGLAKHGYTYVDILKHYYQGIEVTNMWWVLEN